MYTSTRPTVNQNIAEGRRPWLHTHDHRSMERWPPSGPAASEKKARPELVTERSGEKSEFTNQPISLEVLKWSLEWVRILHRLQRKYTQGSPGKVLGIPVSATSVRRKLVQRHKTTTASGGSWKAHCFLLVLGGGSGIDCEWEIYIYI